MAERKSAAPAFTDGRLGSQIPPETRSFGSIASSLIRSCSLQSAQIFRVTFRASGGGTPIQDVITDIAALNSQAAERLGYPTQKPVSLLERIIRASSNENDTVLDPFCGCGTTIHAAANLKRRWIGIDVSYYAVALIQRRMKEFTKTIEVGGIPADLASAEALAERDPYGFQQWSVAELGCQLWNDGKKGADRGIDGEMYFLNGPGAAGRLLVQVKGGKHVGPKDVRDFAWVVNREKAEMGVFVCRGRPTKEMLGEASELGRHRIGSKSFPRLQVVDMESWFAGQRPSLPTPVPMRATADNSSRQKKKSRRPDPRQPQFTYVFSKPDEPMAIDAFEGTVVNPQLLPDVIVVGRKAR